MSTRWTCFKAAFTSLWQGLATERKRDAALWNGPFCRGMKRGNTFTRRETRLCPAWGFSYNERMGFWLNDGLFFAFFLIYPVYHRVLR